MIAEFLSDLNAKILADMKLFLDYWYVWVGGIGIFIGLLWLYTKLSEVSHRDDHDRTPSHKERHDGQQRD